MTHSREAKYNQTFQKHGESPKALQWASYRAAAIRYKNLTADLDFSGKSVLDAGCGMGDILPFLYAESDGSDDFDYLGVDPTAVFIETARRRYDGHKFIVADPFTDQLDGAPFDIVLCSGVLNAHGDDWLVERQRMITRLFDLATEAVAFNMAGGFAPPDAGTSQKVAYADAQTIVDFCKTLTSKLVVRSDYHTHDFTIVLYK